TPFPGGGIGLLDRFLAADGLERVIDASTIGPLANDSHRILPRCVDDLCGAERGRELEFAPGDIDCDDALRAGNRGTLDHIQTYPAGSEDRHSAAGANLRCIEDRSD